jgi:hypothetical protein
MQEKQHPARNRSLDRRAFLQIAAAGAAASVTAQSSLAITQSLAPDQHTTPIPSSNLIATVSAYIAKAATANLPLEIVEIRKHRSSHRAFSPQP